MGGGAKCILLLPLFRRLSLSVFFLNPVKSDQHHNYTGSKFSWFCNTIIHKKQINPVLIKKMYLSLFTFMKNKINFFVILHVIIFWVRWFIYQKNCKYFQMMSSWVNDDRWSLDNTSMVCVVVFVVIILETIQGTCRNKPCLFRLLFISI